MRSVLSFTLLSLMASSAVFASRPLKSKLVPIPLVVSKQGQVVKQFVLKASPDRESDFFYEDFQFRSQPSKEGFQYHLEVFHRSFGESAIAKLAVVGAKDNGRFQVSRLKVLANQSPYGFKHAPQQKPASFQSKRQPQKARRVE